VCPVRYLRSPKGEMKHFRMRVFETCVVKNEEVNQLISVFISSGGSGGGEAK